jgi:hypothetical protein
MRETERLKACLWTAKWPPCGEKAQNILGGNNLPATDPMGRNFRKPVRDW